MKALIPQASIERRIISIRGYKVMLDADLADIYGVSTKRLNEQVKRNRKRFPEDFMFQLTKEEMQNWVSQSVIPNRIKMGIRIPPLAFAEQGVAMLSSVLNSDRAIMVNIKIIRVFTKIRSMLDSHRDILSMIDQLQMKDSEHDEKILLIFEVLKKLEQSQQSKGDNKQRKRIGFKPDQ